MGTVNKEFIGFDLLPNEQWSFIPDINHKYIISTCGRVASFIRGAYRIRPTFVAGSGYLQVAFSEKGKRTMYYVHRLVGLAFIPNPNKLHYINHKDENKTNNHIDNLEWCTAKYNLDYSGITNRWLKVYRDDLSLLKNLSPFEHFKSKRVMMKFSRFKLAHKFARVYSWNSDGKCLSFDGFESFAEYLNVDILSATRICFLNYYLNSLIYSYLGNYPTIKNLKNPFIPDNN